MPNLILMRSIGETIVIDERITITITGHRGNQVKVAIEAPVEVKIRRGELAPSSTQVFT